MNDPQSSTFSPHILQIEQRALPPIVYRQLTEETLSASGIAFEQIHKFERASKASINIFIHVEKR